MKDNRRFKTKKTAIPRIKSGEVLKIDLTNVRIAMQNHALLFQSFVLKIKERIATTRYRIK